VQAVQAGQLGGQGELAGSLRLQLEIGQGGERAQAGRQPSRQVQVEGLQLGPCCRDDSLRKCWEGGESGYEI